MDSGFKVSADCKMICKCPNMGSFFDIAWGPHPGYMWAMICYKCARFRYKNELATRRTLIKVKKAAPSG